MSIIEAYIKHPVLLTLIYKACLADGLILVHKRNVKVLKANKDQAFVRYGGVATASGAQVRTVMLFLINLYPAETVA